MTEKEIKSYLFKLLTKLKDNKKEREQELLENNTHKFHEQEDYFNEFVIYNKKLKKYFLDEEYINYVYDKFNEQYGKILEFEPILNIVEYFNILKPYFNDIDFDTYGEVINYLYDDFVLNCYGKQKKLKNNINNNSIVMCEIEGVKYNIQEPTEKRKVILNYLDDETNEIQSYLSFHYFSKDFVNKLINIKTFTTKDLKVEFENYLNKESYIKDGKVCLFYNEPVEYELADMLKKKPEIYNKMFQDFVNNKH